MYVVVEIAGKQYTVQQDDTLYVSRLDAEIGDTLSFDRVLLVGNDDNVTVGTPVVNGAEVKAEVLDHVRGDKLVVFKKKRRKGYRVKNGHRQPYSRIEIKSVSA